MAASTEGGSLVSNILKKAATFDEVYLEETIAKVEKKSNDLKEETLQFLKQNYDEFMAQADNTISIEQKVQEVTKEFERLNTKVETDLKGRLVKSIGKKEELEKQLNETDAKIKHVQKLVTIHRKLEQMKVDLSRKRYIVVAKAISETNDLVNRISQEGCEAKVFYALKNQLAIVKSDLHCELQQEWNSYIKWMPAIPTQELSLTAALEVQHTIPNEVAPGFEEINESMGYIFVDGEREGRIKKYAIRLLNAFIYPLLKNRVLEIVVTPSGNDQSMIISFKEIQNGDESIGTCITSIHNLFGCIRSMLSETQRDYFMSSLGQTIEPDFTPLFLKHVLSNRIPESGANGGKAFSVTSSLVSELQENLIELKLFDESYTALTDYTTNVDTHIATQRCHAILKQARDLLLQPLHNTVQTTEQDTLAPLEKLNVGGTFVTGGAKQLRLTGSPKELDIGLLSFAFPSCLVSESIKQLVDLLYDTLVNCLSVSSPNVAVQLYETCRDVVEMSMVIPMAYHQDSIRQIPRNAMIQHNNYMFMAHNLLTIGHRFHSRVECLENLSFIDYVPRLRKLGEECFLGEMEKQSNSILECLNAFTSFDGVADRQDELERVIKQAMLLIFNLSRVYSETLHTKLYRRCQGALLNVLLNELISRTLALVDIAASDANCLGEVFEAEIITKAPVALSLMSDEDQNTLTNICQNWERLHELIFILSASQNDIVNRWAVGKGSLAKEFSVAEVKQLIRAIFKNTERRADTLTKII